MHICFISNEYPKEGFAHGGVGTFLKTLAPKLVAAGHSVTVVGINYLPVDEHSVENGVAIYRLKNNKQKGLTWWLHAKAVNRKMKEIHRENSIDIVETPELGLAFLAKIEGVKYVIRMHGGHHYFAKAENRSKEWWKAFQEKRSFRKADHIIAVSDYVKETTKDLLGLEKKTIEVIFNPIDISKFFDASKEDVVPHTILFAGSIVEKKGIRQLVESLEYLVDEFPNIQLFIAGRGGNLPGTRIPYLPVLKKSISEKTAQHIKFLGLVPNNEIPQIIAKSHICCYPSHMEAMPVAWLEVLAMGKIFIGSLTGPGPEAVKNGITGILANPFSPEDIAEQIKWVFEHSAESKQIGQSARVDIVERFGLKTIVGQNIEFYKSIL